MNVKTFILHFITFIFTCVLLEFQLLNLNNNNNLKVENNVNEYNKQKINSLKFNDKIALKKYNDYKNYLNQTVAVKDLKKNHDQTQSLKNKNSSNKFIKQKLNYPIKSIVRSNYNKNYMKYNPKPSNFYKYKRQQPRHYKSNSQFYIYPKLNSNQNILSKQHQNFSTSLNRNKINKKLNYNNDNYSYKKHEIKNNKSLME